MAVRDVPQDAQAIPLNRAAGESFDQGTEMTMRQAIEIAQQYGHVPARISSGSVDLESRNPLDEVTGVWAIPTENGWVPLDQLGATITAQEAWNGSPSGGGNRAGGGRTVQVQQPRSNPLDGAQPRPAGMALPPMGPRMSPQSGAPVAAPQMTPQGTPWDNRLAFADARVAQAQAPSMPSANRPPNDPMLMRPPTQVNAPAYSDPYNYNQFMQSQGLDAAGNPLAGPPAGGNTALRFLPPPAAGASPPAWDQVVPPYQGSAIQQPQSQGGYVSTPLTLTPEQQYLRDQIYGGINTFQQYNHSMPMGATQNAPGAMYSPQYPYSPGYR